jgi:hypothetical protein
MVIKYTKIFHCKTLQNFSQIGIFGLKNKPSGNPGGTKIRLMGDCLLGSVFKKSQVAQNFWATFSEV